MIMHVTFDSLKTFYNILVQKLKNHRGNWNQNDPTADDYIKNRPFYSEGMKETTIMDMVVNFDNSSSNMESSGPTVYQTMIDDYSVKSFKIGEIYTVIWDGQTYKCTAQDISGIGTIGNASLIGYEDTGEPFLIGAEQGYGYIMLSIEDGNHTMVVKTITEIVKKLDKKFIDMPDDIVTGEELNEGLNYVQGNMYASISNLSNQVVKTVSQSLTSAKKSQARTNIGAASNDEVVKIVSQTLTDTQKAQARNNIGAGTSNFSGRYTDLTSKPNLATVATSGSYNDLTDKPTIVQADWAMSSATNASYINNRICYNDCIDTGIGCSTITKTDTLDSSGLYYTNYTINSTPFSKYSTLALDCKDENLLFALSYPHNSDDMIEFKYKKCSYYKDVAKFDLHCWGNPHLLSEIDVLSSMVNKFSLKESLPDTGEPFLFLIDSGAEIISDGVFVISREPMSTSDIYTRVYTLKTLDEIYIPDTIARVDDIQTYVDEAIENLDIPTSSPDITGLATETYVNDAIANLVNSAPDALNTLDELAAALGDDENFATTVTNQIAGKLDASALTGAINDALAQAKTSGEFNGADGQDYVLTPADKTEIAEMAANLVEIPEQESGDSLVLIVSVDAELSTDTTMVATHSPAEILEAVNAGKFIMFQVEGLRFDFASCSDTRATFSTTTVEFNQSEYSTYSINVTIIADKTMEIGFEGGLILPTTGKVGQIAKFIGSSKTEWADPDLFIVTIDTTDENNPTASHSSNEIYAAAANGQIPVLNFNGMPFLYVSLSSSETTSFFKGSVLENNAVELDYMVTVTSTKTISIAEYATANIATPTANDAGKVLTATGMDSWEWKEPTGGNSDNNTLIVNIDIANMTCSHSASEIIAAVSSGKVVFAMPSSSIQGLTFNLYGIDESTNLVAFHVPINEDGFVATMIVTVNEDKTIEIMDEKTIGVPSGGTEGQVLTADANGKPVWSDASSGLPTGGTAGQILVTNANGVSEWANPDTIEGAKGDKGDAGETGPSGYTPVRGTDYWTEADKAEIKSYVDDAILGGEW